MRGLGIDSLRILDGETCRLKPSTSVLLWGHNRAKSNNRLTRKAAHGQLF
jgi:endo-1,4-beta-mannosidase